MKAGSRGNFSCLRAVPQNRCRPLLLFAHTDHLDHGEDGDDDVDVDVDDGDGDGDDDVGVDGTTPNASPPKKINTDLCQWNVLLVKPQFGDSQSFLSLLDMRYGSVGFPPIIIN